MLSSYCFLLFSTKINTPDISTTEVGEMIDILAGFGLYFKRHNLFLQETCFSAFTLKSFVPVCFELFYTLLETYFKFSFAFNVFELCDSNAKVLEYSIPPRKKVLTFNFDVYS